MTTVSVDIHTNRDFDGLKIAINVQHVNIMNFWLNPTIVPTAENLPWRMRIRHLSIDRMTCYRDWKETHMVDGVTKAKTCALRVESYHIRRLARWMRLFPSLDTIRITDISINGWSDHSRPLWNITSSEHFQRLVARASRVRTNWWSSGHPDSGQQTIFVTDTRRAPSWFDGILSKVAVEPRREDVAVIMRTVVDVAIVFAIPGLVDIICSYLLGF